MGDGPRVVLPLRFVVASVPQALLLSSAVDMHTTIIVVGLRSSCLALQYESAIASLHSATAPNNQRLLPPPLLPLPLPLGPALILRAAPAPWLAAR